MLEDEAQAENDERHQPDGLRQRHALHLLGLGLGCRSGQGSDYFGVTLLPFLVAELLRLRVREHVVDTRVDGPHAYLRW